MLPVIALVGRPNVGKSTLFNRLTKTRDALVANFSGLTRDRKYGTANIGDSNFIVIDTGGLSGGEQGIEAMMAKQSLQAIDEADIVAFMVDARAGTNPSDVEIAQHLRKQQKQVVLVANKIDGVDQHSAIADFYQLGLGEAVGISASHGRNIHACFELLLARISELHDVKSANQELSIDEVSDGEEAGTEAEFESEEPLTEDAAELQADAYASQPIKLAVVGKPNVGKSTLTNRILGEERVLVYDMPGTTRDSVFIPMQRNDKEYVLIDTAGVRRRKNIDEKIEKFSIVKTLQAIEESNVVLLVMDAREGVTEQDLSLLSFVINAGRSLVLAVNKWDGLDQYSKNQIKSELDRRLGFADFARTHFISALHGSGVGNLFASVEEAFACATKRINTALLTRIMKMAQDEHTPPMVRGRRVKLKYAHAGGYNPPIVVVHGNQVTDLPDSYKRFLTNYFRKSLDVVGTPIKIEFKEGTNPFAGRKNTLTLSQQRKRKRLMNYIKKNKK